MTRVNLVYVQDLADQHLFAEWREIKMVPAALRRSLKTQSVEEILEKIPKRYTLNAGHVSFFFNKMRFLYRRYLELDDELRNRDYNISAHEPTDIFFDDIPEIFLNNWEAEPDEIAVNVERIVLRLNEKPDWYKHWGKPTPPEYFAALYKLQLDRMMAYS